MAYLEKVEKTSTDDQTDFMVAKMKVRFYYAIDIFHFSSKNEAIKRLESLKEDQLKFYGKNHPAVEETQLNILKFKEKMSLKKDQLSSYPSRTKRKLTNGTSSLKEKAFKSRALMK